MTTMRLLPPLPLTRQLRKLLSPPRTYSRCKGCHSVVVRRWRQAPSGWHFRPDGIVCGTWARISQTSASAVRAQLRRVW